MSAEQSKPAPAATEPTAKAPFWRRPAVPIAVLALGFLALLLAGALANRQAFLTRGIPPDLPQPVAHAGAQLGLNVYLLDTPTTALAETMQEIQALGVDTIKQPFYYNENFDWNTADRLIDAARAEGLTLVPLLDGDPAQNYAPPADPQTYAQWTAEFAARYGDSVDYYIIWDEPNLNSHWGGRDVNANEYAALLSAASTAIRTADSDAFIVAAPLAPTEETGPQNLRESLFLQELYEAGAADAFDIVAAKPYGFSSGPQDRQVAAQHLNFSRVIQVRETMTQFGDENKAVWAGNWGWNSLPDGWAGAPSIWGQATAEEQARWTVAALERARREWPWVGLMFLENWQPGADSDDPRWGFSVAGRQAAEAIAAYQAAIDPGVAYPGFHLAQDGDPAQAYAGGWRFSPEFGADISQPEEGEAADQARFTFWGTEVGLRVRRANFRARLYATVDGEPANALPRDENGAALVLTSPDPAEDAIVLEPVAANLAPGVHVLEITAARGWDQWALNGFSVGYSPAGVADQRLIIFAALGGLLLLALGAYLALQAQWGTAGQRLRGSFLALSEAGQLALTALAALIVVLTGWLTWGEQIAGLYRRLGDGGQLALTAAAASVFYVTPAFLVYVLALAVLFVLIYLRPAWGLALVAFAFPFYVPQLTKPIFAYRFSPVEIFMLVTFAAFALRTLIDWAYKRRQGEPVVAARAWQFADYAVLLFTLVATVSLLFTERLDVATNEWRLVIIEPALFYLVLRLLRPTETEMWVILDAFVLGGVAVAAIGLGQYASGQNLITAEAGLMRLRSIYGSPNNVALYLGRIIPLLGAMLLLGQEAAPRRRWAYSLALIVLGLATLLTFSRGGLLLGLPAGLLVVLWIWLRQRGRSPWPWAVAFALLAGAGLFLAQRVPQLAGRLNLSGATGVFRLNLWRSSLEMIREHPLFGVGLDNFLYAYRGRYILDAAWQEPNLNHPHNIVLDFATRLGLFGLLAGAVLIFALARCLVRAVHSAPQRWLPVAAGFSGSLAAMLLHGLVDHSFFLVDLAFSFYLMLGTAVWLDNLSNAPKIAGQSFHTIRLHQGEPVQ